MARTESILLGVTGGIGSGKSYVCRKFAAAGFPVFDTDTAARLEMLENEELRQRLRCLVSPDVFRADGTLNKPVIRAFLHSSPRNAALFDGEVHPCVRMRWRRWAAERTERLVLMECALLYEANFDTEVSRTLLVTAPESVRIARVVARDGIPEATVRRWIAMQMPEEEKARRADFIIRNDGAADIDEEVRKIIRRLS